VTDPARPYLAAALARELEVAERLAREAGALALRYRDGDLRVELKEGDEPVTIVDQRASRIIVAGLAAAFPDDCVVSEEEPQPDKRIGAERAWFVDPIDGTKDYIAGRDGFSVMIGLNMRGRPAAGVVYQPVGDRLFAAAPGVGAWFTAPGVAPRRLRVSPVTEVAQIRLVASKSHREGAIDEVKSALGIRDEFNIGSVGLKLGLIALAERDLYVNPSPHCKAWDTSAPEAILHEAGGRMTDMDGTPVRYDQPAAIHARGLVASNGHLHDAVLAKLAPQFPPTRAL
jgi:3'(2'), 5'-bisphosphate nucleotidase